MISGVLLGIALLAPAKFNFYELGPYEAGVPRPESILGYEIGSRHTVYRDQERAVLAIANAAKGRVVPIEYGMSSEGRPLRVFAISSPENIKNLEQIRQNNLGLANPSSVQDPSDLIRKNPAIVWINECIHGDETASFESGMALMYNLAASRGKRIGDVLSNTVVILNPVYNPDGHERYVVAYNSLPTGNPDPDAYDGAVPFAFTGRANHYRFDLNRDRVAMSQAETRQEVALFLRWMPQVYADQHGQVETYFFPPVQQSINVNVDRDRYKKWTEILGRATAKAFDDRGWVYSIRDSFDLYNVCYLDSHTTLMGAIGMTHETDGGRFMARRRDDGTILTLLDGIAKHFTAAMAVIETASKNRAELLASYSAYKRKAANGEHAGKFQRVVVEPENERELIRFAQHLERTGIKYKIAAKGWTQQNAHDYWSPKVGERAFKAGSLVVDMAQPMGDLAKSWLEPGSDFEPDFIARQKELAKVRKEGKGEAEIDDYEFYDGTAWCRIYGYGLKAWWCESAPSITETGMGPDRWTAPKESSVGYYLPYRDQDDILFAARALNAGLRVSMNQRAMQVGGEAVTRGTFLFLAARNDEGYAKKLFALAQTANEVLEPLSTGYPDEGRFGPGGSGIIQLRKPNIGIVMGTPGSLNGGPIWFLMEKEFGLPFTPLTTSALSGNLDRFTAIVVTGGGATSSGKFGDWIRAGGCAVSISNPGWAIGSSNLISLDSTQSEPDLPGSLFLAELDRRSFLGYGYPLPDKGPIPVAVPVSGSSFYKAPKSGAAVMLSAEDSVKKLLSGWAWDDTEKDLAGTAWLVDAPAGRGRAVLFMEDPTERAQWPGLFKMLLNAMIIGPSA